MARRLLLAALLPALAGAAAPGPGTWLRVSAIKPAGAFLRVDGTDIEADAPRSLALPLEMTLKDLSTLEQKPLAKVSPGSVIWAPADGSAQGGLFLPPGAKVHASVSQSNPQVAASLERAVGSAQVQAPAADDRDAADLHGFLFTLEFALGAPFNVAQEQEILRAARSAGRSQYQGYADRVPELLALDEERQEFVRSELEKVVREWMASAKPSNPLVKIVKAQLAAKGKVVSRAATPPLTEMAATSFGEVFAFALALQRDAAAEPSAIDAAAAYAMRRVAVERWASFSAEERASIAVLPGRWVTLRRVLDFGSEEEKEQIRSALRNLGSRRDAPPPATAASAPNDVSREIAQKNFNAYLMSQMRQQTFNTYMWSRGFNYGPATGKMW